MVFFPPHHSSNHFPHNSSPYRYSSLNSSSPFFDSSSPYILFNKFFFFTLYASLSYSFNVLPITKKWLLTLSLSLFDLFFLCVNLLLFFSLVRIIVKWLNSSFPYKLYLDKFFLLKMVLGSLEFDHCLHSTSHLKS